MNNTSVHQKFFHILLFVVTIALAWILLPFFGAIFWGTILAILFQPLQRYLAARLGKRRNLAAFATLALTILVVILPLTFVAATLVQEIGLAYAQFKSAQPNFAAYFQDVIHWLPDSVQALSIGQNTFQFVVSFGVMLYLVFFLLRDGGEIGRRIRRALPLDEGPKQHLIAKFTTVVRATVKGNIAVAAVQGFLGGMIFMFLGIQGSLLWGVLMGFLSLLPAIGAALVWAPAAAYLLITGDIWRGVILILFCVLVIGMVDNVLRPILVGKDTKMPDWVVLISTLGGMALFGINGFVIGPLIAALFMASWDLFTQDQEANTHE